MKAPICFAQGCFCMKPWAACTRRYKPNQGEEGKEEAGGSNRNMKRRKSPIRSIRSNSIKSSRNRSSNGKRSSGW